MSTNIRALSVCALLAACGRDLTPSDIKSVGVGLNPDEIGAEAEPYGGFVELNWVDFAGGQLPVALAGLASYSPVGPDLATFKAPFAMVLGFGFIMQTDLPAPDAQLGTFARPPAAAGTCQTVYEPGGYLNNLADVGQQVTFASDDGSVELALSRTPEIYPADARDVFSYYFGVQGWRPSSMSRWVPGSGSQDIADMTPQTYQTANWAFGETLNMSFPGGMPPASATVGSIPVPLAAQGSDTSVDLPARPEGVFMSWSGPVYDAYGLTSQETGDASTCLEYQSPLSPPSDASDCEELTSFPDTPDLARGQMYTGPWDTEDGVLFQWVPPSDGEGDTVSITVRFLRAADPASPDFALGVVQSEADEQGRAAWASAQEAGDVPASVDVPLGQRAPEACEDPDDVSWIPDPTLFESDGTPLPWMQGDPSARLVEVTCTVSEEVTSSGFAEFRLTPDMVADALAYAQLHDGGGAIFYFSRSNEVPITTPAVRDAYGKRREISPVLVVSRAAQLGRFWYDL